MMDDDAQLLRRYAREGAEEAFAELVRRHLGLVYGSALRRVNGNAALAEEVAQSVFASVAHEASELEKRVVGGVALAGWLYAATKNAASNALRAEVRRVRREQEAFVMSELESGGAGGLASADDAEVWAQVRPELEAVMDSLSVADRDAVLLRFFEGKAFGEIGAALRVSEDAARVRVNRALEKLRGLLAKRGIRSTAVALGGLLAGNAAVAAPAGMAASVTATAVGTALTAGTASVVGILSFMSAIKITVGVSGVVVALAVGTAIHQANAARRAEAELAASRGEQAELRVKAADFEKRLASAVDEASRALAEKAPAPVAPAQKEPQKKRADGRNGDPRIADTASRLDVLYASAEYQEMALKSYQVSLPLAYGPLYRKLGLSPEQIARFEAALMEKQQRHIDTMAAARMQGVSVADDSLQKLSTTDAGGDPVRAVLSEADYAQYQEYRGTSNARRPVDLLAQNLYATEAPLSPSQADELTRIVAANTAKPVTSGLIGTAAETDWNKVIIDAKGTLSESQLRTLNAQTEKIRTEKAMLELSKRLMQAASKPTTSK
jgi:RNA polymerase sigma factor (sigma-70 family)